MNITAVDLLLWVRGPGFNLALALFTLGMVVRFMEIFGLGRRREMAPASGHRIPFAGIRTVLSRFWIPRGMLRKAPIIYLGGYLFHLSYAVVILFFVPHIALVREMTGLSWPALPSPMVDMAAVTGMVAMLALLSCRLLNPVKRFISTFEDYLVWTVTFLPLITGYLASQGLLPSYPLALALHLLSVELLLVVFPFTKLMHTFTAFATRWHIGEAYGHRGVSS